MSRDFVGGHELDAMPSKFLFNIVWGLCAIVLASLVTCIQIFNAQHDALMSERGAEGSFVLGEYRAEMLKVTTESGQTEIPKVSPDGQTSVEVLQYKPLADARKEVLSDPAKLRAAAPPPGWVHPDDVASGGAATGGPATTPAGQPAATKVAPPAAPTPAAPTPGH